MKIALIVAYRRLLSWATSGAADIETARGLVVTVGKLMQQLLLVMVDA